MPPKPLELHPAALEELKHALLWYRERSPAAALRFAAEVERSVDLIAASPSRWPLGQRGTHRFILRHFPFAIVYRQTEATVQVIAIAHGKRRPEYWRKRL